MQGRLLPPSKYQQYKEIYQSPYSRNTFARFHNLQTGLLYFTFVWTAEKKTIKRLQHVQNAAARMVVLTPKHEHISPVLQKLYWLPVEHHIIFRVLLLTFKCLNGIVPSYLSDLIRRYIRRRNLTPANGHRLFDVKYNLRNYVFRSFSVASPQLWNDMPQGIRSCDSLNDFKKKLKFIFLGKRF